jgi:uncharacterized protein (DUF983 family)
MTAIPAPADAGSSAADLLAERPVKPALLRGWRRRCPACGEGRMMSGYLAVAPACPACGEDLTPQRADDGPAYATILIVGHLAAPLMLWVYTAYRPSPAVFATTFALGAVVLSLWLLPRLKGAFVALQWAKRMGGFGADRDG